jgi:hypothetical protein
MTRIASDQNEGLSGLKATRPADRVPDLERLEGLGHELRPCDAFGGVARLLLAVAAVAFGLLRRRLRMLALVSSKGLPDVGLVVGKVAFAVAADVPLVAFVWLDEFAPCAPFAVEGEVTGPAPVTPAKSESFVFNPGSASAKMIFAGQVPMLDSRNKAGQALALNAGLREPR